MAIGDLNPAVWRIDVYELKPEAPWTGVVTDLSQLYTSDLTIKKQRNYPDEIHFTLDLQQLENRATALNTESHSVIEPYKHKVQIFRNGQFMAQGIVMKVTANLNNQSKNTLEVNCVDFLGLFEKRLINQDYGEGSWADFAKQVIYDAQHEPNRIYNYAWEGDGTGIDNAWFRGWKYRPGDELLKQFPEWEPNKLYSMYDTCTYGGKFWEAKERAFYSGETFSESNWTLLGVMDPETGEVAPAYGVWREDEEEKGPTGTALGGWGGTSSCHMTAASFAVNNAGDVTSISMKDSTVSTSLVAPYLKAKMKDDDTIFARVMVRDANAKYDITDVQMGNKTRFRDLDAEKFYDQLQRVYPEIPNGGDFVTSITADENGETTAVYIHTRNGRQYKIWEGDFFAARSAKELALWGIVVPGYYTLTFNKNDSGAGGQMDPIKTTYGTEIPVPQPTFTVPAGKHWKGWNTSYDGKGDWYAIGSTFTITENATLYAIWEDGESKFVLSHKPANSSSWESEEFIEDLRGLWTRMRAIAIQYEQEGITYDIKIAQEGWDY